MTISRGRSNEGRSSRGRCTGLRSTRSPRGSTGCTRPGCAARHATGSCGSTRRVTERDAKASEPSSDQRPRRAGPEAKQLDGLAKGLSVGQHRPCTSVGNVGPASCGSSMRSPTSGSAPAPSRRTRASITSSARISAGLGRPRSKTSRRGPAFRRERSTPALERLRLRRFRDERGGELIDLPRAPLPPADTPAPVRFLPWWDAVLLVHARRTGVMPEEYRPIVFSTKNPPSVPTFLVDGRVAGAWRYDRRARRARALRASVATYSAGAA